MYYPHILGMLLSYVGFILHYIMRVDWLFVGGGTSSPSTKMCQFILVLFQTSIPCLKMFQGHVQLLGKLAL